jgi:hypothetical protein
VAECHPLWEGCLSATRSVLCLGYPWCPGPSRLCEGGEWLEATPMWEGCLSATRSALRLGYPWYPGLLADARGWRVAECHTNVGGLPLGERAPPSAWDTPGVPGLLAYARVESGWKPHQCGRVASRQRTPLSAEDTPGIPGLLADARGGGWPDATPMWEGCLSANRSALRLGYPWYPGPSRLCEGGEWPGATPMWEGCLSASALRSPPRIPLVSRAFSPMRGWRVAGCHTNVGGLPLGKRAPLSA